MTGEECSKQYSDEVYHHEHVGLAHDKQGDVVVPRCGVGNRAVEWSGGTHLRPVDHPLCTSIKVSTEIAEDRVVSMLAHERREVHGVAIDQQLEDAVNRSRREKEGVCVCVCV